MQAINPLELASEALKVIQTRFYEDFPAHPEEARYGFATPSTMKPTQWTCKLSSIERRHYKFGFISLGHN
jgi:hypothetical protein